MGETMLSIEYGPKVGTQKESHIQLWQDVVNARPNATALIAKHQSPTTFRWVGSQHVDTAYVQWTFADLDRGARRLATALNRLTHIDRRPIAALINNQAEWALLYWASAYLHAPFVPINPKIATRTEELNHMLDLVGPAVLVSADLHIASQLEQSISEKLMASIDVRLTLSASGAETTQIWSLLGHVMSGEPTPPDTPDVMSADDTIVILFTSGTTSLPKPCALTSFQCLNAALGYMDAQKVTSSHRFVQHLPGFHSYGIGWSLGFWLRGGTVIFPSDSFEAQATLECFDQHRATHMGLVPTTAQAILAHPAFAKTDLSTLASIDISGAGVLPSLVDACTAALKVPSSTSYGMTESPGTAAWGVDEGSVLRDGEVMSGRPVRNTVQKICEPDSRHPIPRGQLGELHNGGPQVIPRYMDPKVSSKDFYQDEDGTRWIITGDQAVMDHDGAVRITGRYKDMIIRGGENIAPAGIEDYLSKKEAVLLVYVVGAPDDMAGEVPIAVITTKEGQKADIAGLKQDVTRDLGPAFAPKLILHLNDDLGLDAFPSTASGKIRKVELAKVVKGYLKAQAEAGLDKSGATIDSLLGIWKMISGADGLLPTTAIDAFADSLMMMQLSGIVKKELNRDITVEDFKLCESIQDQANLIESRPLKSAVAIKPRREGPPTLLDMPHAREDVEVYERTQHAVSDMLAPLGMKWDDVEDVVPLPDWDAIFCHRIRPSSWNLRFSYHAPVDVTSLEKVIRASLEFHPTMRSMALEQDGETLLVTLRSTDEWCKSFITTGWEVQTKDDLNNLVLNDPVLDNASAPGPLVKFHVAKILEDNTSGLVLVASHSVNDMSMTNVWLEDVVNLLTGEAIPVHHAQFKDYATAFFDHRDGLEADNGIEYWAKKHQGVSLLPETTFWPPQRAPEWFKGIDADWSRWTGAKARKGERAVARSEKVKAQTGIRGAVKVDDLQRLKAEHNVPVFMLVKAAIAILNISKTGGKQAVFGTINAARSWPFSSDYSALEREAYTGNPLDISGCTTEYVLDRIDVGSSKSLLAFMQQVTKDEEKNSAYAHTPIFRIIERLRDPISADDTRTFAERERDAESYLLLIRRQSFNWLPTAPNAQDPRGLRLQQMLTRMDNGLTITGFLMDDKRSVALSFSWDAEHLSFIEAERSLNELIGLVDKMGKEENWLKSVGELLRM
ncbi:acetyl CoA synthetase-like protein [Dothistroma septosporum NZE10]|uniref:Acetyl CoA synthetase-like protein n=1 Tax=Dothistroma septosporum (strain NZE10 / CBS 128990) TaxID=675120 RepID=N1PIZ8_DOTSN|nr:acetyl CoA synthetase-like protein [Dothistroma septosporum NZE10]